MRGPSGTPVGKLRRVLINNLVAHNVEPRFASIISGIPGHRIEDVKLSNIRIIYKGGGTLAHAAVTPPEKESNYPEPSMFGDMPAYGFFIRHADGIELSNVEIGYAKEELRPAVVLHNVNGADFFNVDAQVSKGASAFDLQNVRDFSATHCKGVRDTKLERVERTKL